MKVETGASESHPTPLPLDQSAHPGVATPAPRGNSGAVQVPARDTTGERLAQMAASEADIAAAQSAGHAAELGRRDHYAADVLPQGAAYGDAVDLPPVPSAAVPPAASDLYPYAGDEPPPAAAGFPGEYGGG